MTKTSKKPKKQHKLLVAVFVCVFAAVGAILILRIKAASPVVSTEPENGQVRSPAVILGDTTASSGKAIQFKQQSTGTPKPVGLGQANGPSGAWNLKFQDEFNGTSLDTAVWTSGWVGGTSPVQNQELACYLPSQVSVSGGSLHLKADPVQSACSKGTNPHPYTSGAVDSHGKKTFAFGYFEARLWLDASSSKIYNWPAWWLDGVGTWPSTGELDIMEGLSGSPKATWHGPGGSGGIGGWSGAQGAGWHTYAAEWASGVVTAFYDGVKVGSYSSSSNVTSAQQFMVLGMQMSPENQYGGPQKAPTEMQVDYVRVWQR